MIFRLFSDRLEKLAEANRNRIILEAEAEAEAIRIKGEAEAFALEAKGKAEAEQLARKAEAYKLYKEAAVAEILLDALPKVIRVILHAIMCIHGNKLDSVFLRLLLKPLLH